MITTSLVTSKKLKEAGFRQDTDFVFGAIGVPGDIQYELCYRAERGILKSLNKFQTFGVSCNEDVSSPTTDDILNDLISTIWVQSSDKEYRLRIEKMANGYMVEYGDLIRITNNLLSEALAEMWLWVNSEELK